MIKNCEICNSDELLFILQIINNNPEISVCCRNCGSVANYYDEKFITEQQLIQLFEVPTTHVDEDGSILYLGFICVNVESFFDKNWRAYCEEENVDIEAHYYNSKDKDVTSIYGCFD